MSNELRGGGISPTIHTWAIFDALPRPVRDALNYADGFISNESTLDYLKGHGIEDTVKQIKTQYPSKIRP